MLRVHDEELSGIVVELGRALAVVGTKLLALEVQDVVDNNPGLDIAEPVAVEELISVNRSVKYEGQGANGQRSLAQPL